MAVGTAEQLPDRRVGEAGEAGRAAALGLAVAGIDLKLAPDGRIVCLEVNPSPVFSYYELHTGQPIAEAIACLLDPR